LNGFGATLYVSETVKSHVGCKSTDIVLIGVIAGFSAVCAIAPLVGVDEVDIGVWMPEGDRLKSELVSLLENSEVTLEVDVVSECVVDAASVLDV
jgi:hypothetical protein